MPSRARWSGLSARRSSPLEEDLALGNLVLGPARDHVGQRALAAAVRAHDGVHLAGVYGEVHASEDLGVRDGHVQVTDF